MNRYQLEVAQIDRRHRLVVRALSFVGAGGLMVAILWSVGLPPTQWLVRAHALFSSPPESRPAAQTPPRPDAQPLPNSPAAVAIAKVDILPGTESSVSPTPQPLFLVSTSPGRNKNEGAALIGTNPENPQTYAGGAILANGARLAEIYVDHVMLTRDGKSAKLSLHRRNEVAKLSTNALLNVGGEQPSAAPVPVTREVITDYLRPSPVYDGETLRGYQVYPGAKIAVFSRLGLEAGDIITSLNDAPFADPTHAMELFNQLTQGVAIVASVQRKGVNRRITLDGSIMVADQEAAANPAAQVIGPSNMPPT